MDGKKDGNQQETSLTLKYLLENPSLLQPPENDDEGTVCTYFARKIANFYSLSFSFLKAVFLLI